MDNESIIKGRVKVRLDSQEVNDNLLDELITTVCDRIKLRVGAEQVPTSLLSIVVEAVVKMVRKLNFEGISSESADTISTNFVDDVLAEYQEELSAYKKSSNKVTLRFL